MKNHTVAINSDIEQSAKQPLISVIVPCYNAEKYLDKCISSIISQTYNNLEIIIVNDGSTDRSKDICDTWQNKDQRIKVIHKQNEGASYARKTGLEHATGEYITFVDNDDWIDKDMYSNMMPALISTNSDIVQCGVCDVWEDGKITHRKFEHKDGSFEIFNRKEGVLLIVYDQEWHSYMWNKIFKRQMFDNITFPKGRQMDDDTSISHSLFHNALQSVYLRDEYYYYYHRSDSICSTPNIVWQSKNIYDQSNARYERYLFVVQHPEYHSALAYVKNIALSVGITALRKMVANPHYFPDKCFEQHSKRLNAISLSQKDVIRTFISPLKNVEWYILRINPKIYKMIIRMTKKFIHK